MLILTIWFILCILGIAFIAQAERASNRKKP